MKRISATYLSFKNLVPNWSSEITPPLSLFFPVSVSYICVCVCLIHCLFVTASHEDRTWHKVKSPKANKSGNKGEGKVWNEPRLEPCWSMLLIGSLGAIWAWWGKQFHKPKCGSGYVCRVMAWTRQQCLVPYIGFENVRRNLYVCLIPWWYFYLQTEFCFKIHLQLKY